VDRILAGTGDECHGESQGLDETMWPGEDPVTEFVGSDLNFGDMILKEEFDYGGRVWSSFLLVPQEHLEDLFHTPAAIKPIDAYNKAPEFWQKISQSTSDFYRSYLEAQSMSARGSLRRQWFQWKDFDRLEAAYCAFKARANRPLPLSIVARDPIH
jgi:hypothetical protein